MRPKTVTVTSTNSPLVWPLDWRSGEQASIQAVPAGGGNYTIVYTLNNIWDTSITPTYTDITDMVAATTNQTTLGDDGVTAIKVTLNSGTSVTVTVSQPTGNC